MKKVTNLEHNVLKPSTDKAFRISVVIMILPTLANIVNRSG